MGSLAFSSSAEDVITRTLSVVPDKNVAPNPATNGDVARLETLYEVDWTASEIQKGQYKQVALQFPDELLHISVIIHQSLKKRLENDVRLYVLADTSYGSCCVDEVAAQHVDGDLVVHYGYSCLSRPSRLPVLYVFSKAKIDVHVAAKALLASVREELRETESNETTKNFILIPDVAYAHMADELSTAVLNSPLLPQGSHVYFNHVPKRDDPTPPISYSNAAMDITNDKLWSSLGTHSSNATPQSPGRSHRRYTLLPSVALASCTILYVGPESLGLTNLLMTHPENKVISYDPSTIDNVAKVESARTNKLLMRRYALVQRARDADVIGILVGTLGVASYLPLVSHIRKMLHVHRKKSYTLSIGKLSPSKLANFPEIECFVLVACPENSVIDTKEFLRPIITPFELSLALRVVISWPGNYILDFERFIEATDQAGANDESADVDPDTPTFSLVTGKYRHAKHYGEEAPSQKPQDTSAVVLRNKDNALTRLSGSAGAEFLQQRTFQGLEQRLGQDAPGVLEEGRSGIAKGYRDEHRSSDRDKG